MFCFPTYVSEWVEFVSALKALSMLDSCSYHLIWLHDVFIIVVVVLVCLVDHWLRVVWWFLFVMVWVRVCSLFSDREQTDLILKSSWLCMMRVFDVWLLMVAVAMMFVFHHMWCSVHSKCFDGNMFCCFLDFVMIVCVLLGVIWF